MGCRGDANAMDLMEPTGHGQFYYLIMLGPIMPRCARDVDPSWPRFPVRSRACKVELPRLSDPEKLIAPLPR